MKTPTFMDHGHTFMEQKPSDYNTITTPVLAEKYANGVKHQHTFSGAIEAATRNSKMTYKTMKNNKSTHNLASPLNSTPIGNHRQADWKCNGNASRTMVPSKKTTNTTTNQ